MTIAEFFKLLLYPLLFIATTVTKLIWKDYPDDNVAEEIVEMVIEQHTQEKVDLTPHSPESDNG